MVCFKINELNIQNDQQQILFRMKQITNQY